MKSFKIILMLMLFLSIQSLQAEDNTSTETVLITSSELEPQTDDKLNPELLNTLPAVNILNLSGKDCNGVEIKRFIIQTLANADAGILYLENGETVVTVGQYLTLEEANGLRFDPNENFEGNARFTYASVDESDVVDSTPATVTLPIISSVLSAENNDSNNTVVDHVVHTPSCGCPDYETSIPAISPLGLILMFLLTLFAVRKSFKVKL